MSRLFTSKRIRQLDKSQWGDPPRSSRPDNIRATGAVLARRGAAVLTILDEREPPGR